MINDKDIRKQVKIIEEDCNNFLNYVKETNECAYSDRMIESIIDNSNTLFILHQNNNPELYNENTINDKYEYNIFHFWNDSDDLYVNYIITDRKNNNKANVINYYNISDIGVENYDLATDKEIENNLYRLIKLNNGEEFNLPKISDISPLLRHVYECVNSSDANMCHISISDWEELKEYNNFSDDDITKLKEEIKTYDLDNVLTIDIDGYKICGYGCLQTCFNDDTKERTDGFER